MPMSRTIIIIALFVSIATQAQDKGIGIGIMAGDPTGINGKYWLAEDRALTFGLGWGPWGRTFNLHGDYTLQNVELLKDGDVVLDLYYGAGARFRSWSGDRYWRSGTWYYDDRGSIGLGLRVPVGAVMTVDGMPLDFFLEVVPTLELIPATYFDLDLGIGARYWF